MFTRLLKQETGAAAAEMALVAPLLMLIMFGSMELGHYFYSEHIVVKAVRDGARFAARQSFADYTCNPDTVSTTVRDETRWVTRVNQNTNPALSPSPVNPRLAGWTSDASVTVTNTCYDNTAGTFTSFYGEGTTKFPVVTVQATVPYTSLFKFIGFNSTGLQLQATEQAVVMGI